MKVFVQSVNFNSDKKLVDFMERKVKSLEKYYDKIIDVYLFLKVQKTSDKENKNTELKINIPGSELIVKRESKSFEEGVSLAVDSMKRQLKKIKQKERRLYY